MLDTTTELIKGRRRAKGAMSTSAPTCKPSDIIRIRPVDVVRIEIKGDPPTRKAKNDPARELMLKHLRRHTSDSLVLQAPNARIAQRLRNQAVYARRQDLALFEHVFRSGSTLWFQRS